MKKVNLYDFDYTIYNGDSTLDFYKFCVWRNIKIIRFFPIQLFYYFLYKVKIINKKEWKSKFFIFLKEIKNIEDLVNLFWDINYKKIKLWYLKIKSSNDIIISASPSFLLKPISKNLGVKDLIATEVDKKTGILLSENCYGEEKIKRFMEKYPDYLVDKAYTDHISDKPMLELANKGYVVNRDKLTPYNFEY